MIPKIIHYCWFGSNDISDLNKLCLESWRNILPDYKIMKWDESNSDMDVPFMKEAYRQKKYGYLIDYTRLQALKEYGGIFLDLDFLVLKSFDGLLNHDFFLGMIDSKQVGMGIVGAEPNNDIVKGLKDIYSSYKGFDPVPSTDVATTYFKSHDMENMFNTTEGQIVFYPKDFFYEYTLRDAYNNISYEGFTEGKNVFALHLWENTWIKPEFRDFWFGRTRRGYERAILRIIKNPFQGIYYYKDLAYHVLRHLRIKK